MKKDNPFRGGVSFAAAPSEQDEAETKAATKAEKKSGVALKQIDGPDGEIVHMEQGERYSGPGEAKKDRARVTIRHGAPKKPAKKGEISHYEDEKRTELHLKPHQLAGLKVGDKVSIHLKKH